MMKMIKRKQFIVLTILSSLILFFSHVFAATNVQQNPSILSAVISANVFNKAKLNNDWKVAFITGKEAQVVFMSVSPLTNPKNEIGMETHPFDQIIFVVQGKAKAILGGKSSIVNSGDMIFIPQGTAHNFINLNSNMPFKIISVYSAMDIPANSVYKTSGVSH